MFVLFVSLLCLVPRLLCLWIINVCFVCLLAVSCPTITLSMIINVCFVCLPAMSCPTITLSMDYQCLLCLSPCCVLSHDYLIYGLSMFALFVYLLCLVPRLLCLWIINVCFVCLPAVFCPTITLSMDYQCLLCLSPCCVLSHDYFVWIINVCFVCLRAVFCPTITLSADYQCLLCLSPSCVLSHDYFVYGLSMFALFVSLLCFVPRLLCLWIINVCFVCLPAVFCPTITLSMDYQCLLCLSPCCVLSHDYFVYGLSMFALFVSLLCFVPRLLCLWIINVCFVCLPAVFVPRLLCLWIINVCFVCLPAVSCPTIALSMDYQCLLCLSQCWVLSHDCFVYGLSMFALFVSVLCFVPRLLCLWIINDCFVCIPAVFCPTITLSMDYQCFLCLSPCCVLSHDYFVYGLSMFVLFVSVLCFVPRLLCLWIINVCFVCLVLYFVPRLLCLWIINVCFVCLPAVFCPTLTLSMDYQCLLCLSPCCVLSHDYFVYGLSMFALFVSLLCFVRRLLCLWIINVCFVCHRALFCPTITLSMDYQCLLCLSPCCVLSHDCFVYGLSMFALFVSVLCLVQRLLCLWIINVCFVCLVLCFVPRLLCLWIINVCFVCLPAVSCPTITLSMDYQCLLCLSPCCVL